MSMIQLVEDGHLNKSFAHKSANGMSPDLITVHMGTNDCAMRIKHSRHGPVERHSSAKVAEHADLLLKELFARAPRARVFMSSVIHYPREHQCIDGFNALLPEIIVKHQKRGMRVTYVPLAETERFCESNATDRTGASGLCLGDETHPNAAGYLRIAAVFSLAIAEDFSAREKLALAHG